MLKAFIWAFVGVGGQQIMRLITVLVLARLLTPEEFGVVAIAQTILAFAEILQQMGLGSALIQTDALTKRMERSAASAVLATSMLFAVGLYFASPQLSIWFNTPELVNIMPVLLAAFVLTSLNNPSIMLLQRELRLKELALTQVGTFVFGYGVVAIALALAGFSYWSVVWASFVQAILYFFVSHYLRPVWPTLRPDLADLKVLFTFGGGMMITQIFNNFARRGDNMVVAAIFGPAPLGHYTRAYSLMDMANQLFGTAIHKVLFPAFSERRRKGGDVTGRREALYLSHALVALLMMPVSAVMILLAPDIVRILLGPQWTLAGEIFRILGGAMYFRLAYKVSGAFIAAEGAIYRYAATQFLFAIFALGGAWLGAQFSLVGVAIGVTIAILLQFLMLTGLVNSLSSARWSDFPQIIGPAFIASAIATAPAYLVLNWTQKTVSSPLFVTIAVTGIYCVAYIMVLWLFRQNRYVAMVWREASKRLLSRQKNGPTA